MSGPLPSALPPKESLSYRAELIRKALHVGALAFPLAIVLIDRQVVVPVLAGLAILALILDVARHRWALLHRLILSVFGDIMRPIEKPPLGGPIVLNGATWMCAAAAICAAVFPPTIAAAALALVMIGDAAAALVGRRMGRRRFPWSEKSLEGSLAFIVAGFLAALLIVQLGEPQPGIAALTFGTLVGAIAEALPLPLNDNLRVALLAGVAMWLLL